MLESNMDSFEKLADALDRFAREFDPYEYQDAVDDSMDHCRRIKVDLEQGNFMPYKQYLGEIIDCADGTRELLQDAKDLYTRVELMQKDIKKADLSVQIGIAETMRSLTLTDSGSPNVSLER